MGYIRNLNIRVLETPKQSMTNCTGRQYVQWPRFVPKSSENCSEKLCKYTGKQQFILNNVACNFTRDLADLGLQTKELMYKLFLRNG